MKQVMFVAALAIAGTTVAQADEPAVRRLKFAEAIALALSHNPDVAIAQEAIAGAEAHTDGIKSKRLPVGRVELEGHLYAEPYDLPFGTQVFRLYQRDTSTSVVTIAQPLSGLAYLSELIRGAEHTANVTRSEYDRTRLEIAYRAADAYVRVLSARAAAEVAHSAVADIVSGLERAQLLRAADTLTDIDVLRFKSAKASADQVAVHADAAVKTQLAALVLVLGLHDGEPVEVTDDLPVAPPALAMSIDQAQARAVAARPELHGARERVAAADSARTAAHDLYFPDVRAVGTYIHTTGVQPFQPADAAYLGVTLSWNVWDWGATHHAVVEAEHAAAQATLTVTALGDQVRFEVRRSWLAAKADFDNLEAAQTQIATAEEAFRLQKVRFDAGAATTTDVLDAQTDVARGRLQFAVARYDYYLAVVTLARAMGDVPRN